MVTLNLSDADAAILKEALELVGGKMSGPRGVLDLIDKQIRAQLPYDSHDWELALKVNAERFKGFYPAEGVIYFGNPRD